MEKIDYEQLYYDAINENKKLKDRNKFLEDELSLISSSKKSIISWINSEMNRYKTDKYDSFYSIFLENQIPIYKKKIFKAKLNNEIEELFNIQKEIWDNTNLNESQKRNILKLLDIYKIQIK
ncbi:MAG: hypothetical protein HFI86_02080 [Bacilli bacterium]|nr:hypothetical protein [Bacilli bacterium]